jgi:hypothetical protein
MLYDPGGISASRDGEAPMWSAPITSVADSRDISVEARSHGFALPVYASQPTSPPDHATLGTGWVATPCRAGPSPAEALHEVSALHHVASSSSVFIWRTVIETSAVLRDAKEPHPFAMWPTPVTTRAARCESSARTGSRRRAGACAGVTVAAVQLRELAEVTPVSVGRRGADELADQAAG